jgi:hypothetical protein
MRLASVLLLGSHPHTGNNARSLKETNMKSLSNASQLSLLPAAAMIVAGIGCGTEIIDGENSVDLRGATTIRLSCECKTEACINDNMALVSVFKTLGTNTVQLRQFESHSAAPKQVDVEGKALPGLAANWVTTSFGSFVSIDPGTKKPMAPRFPSKLVNATATIDNNLFRDGVAFEGRDSAAASGGKTKSERGLLALQFRDLKTAPAVFTCIMVSRGKRL